MCIRDRSYPHRCGYFICRFVWFICRARCPHRAGENHKPFVTNLQTICRGRWDLPNIPHIPPSGNKANVRRRTMCAPMGEICVYCPLCTIKQPVGNGLDRSETEGRMSLGLLQRPPLRPLRVHRKPKVRYWLPFEGSSGESR